MKQGDMVRFRAPYGYYKWDPNERVEDQHRPWLVGLLIEYHKWEKIASILYDDTIMRLPARDVQKYGRRYLDGS